MTILTIILGLITSNLLIAAENIKLEFSGNLDAQVKQLHNPDSAKSLQSQKTADDWQDEGLYLLYTNINAKFLIKKHTKIELNWFARYAQSNIFNSNYQAPQYSLYPNQVVARDVFKLEQVDINDTNRIDSTLNRFTYEWGDEESKAKFGRMWVQYGNGMVFNPINPFNYPLMFSTLQNIHQGNDGMEFFFNTDPRLKLYLYLFGDKGLTNDDEQVSRTIILRGDWQYSNRVNINYILGEDQKRHKYGFELNYGLDDGALITQIVRNTKRLDKDDSEGLTQLVFGIEKDLSVNWALRLEAGHNPQDTQVGNSLYNAYMPPQEKFIALVTSVQFTELVKLRLNLTTDPTTDFSYFHMDVNHQYDDKLQFHVFFSSTLGHSELKAIEEQQTAQLALPTEFGLGFRSVF